MGRANNRKKARRQATSPAQQPVTTVQAQAKRQLALVDELNAMNKSIRKQVERYLTVCRTWCGGLEPGPAQAPRWAHGFLGRQVLASKFIAQAADGPCLRTAEVPEPAVILGDRARRLHPQRRDTARPLFPVLDGPAFLLGMGVLVDVTRALVGDSPQREELAVLSRGLDGAIPGVPGSVVADALADAVGGRYLRVLPPELLQHVGPAPIVNPLEILVIAGVVAPGDALRAGLAILSSVVILCENDAQSTGKQVA